MSKWTDRWEVIGSEEEIRAGGQGSVVRVKSKVDERVGALKRLHDDLNGLSERRFRMQQEVNALRVLGGEGAPMLFDSNVEQWLDKSEPLWAVMEWVPGETLADRINKKALTIDQALPIFEDLLHTLARCHELGIHHRDLKHDNIILRNDNGRPVLVDFGMTWMRPATNEERDFRTAMGQEIGNRFLRLPEHAPNRHQHHDASDLTMAVGLLFYMLSGVAPRSLRDADGRMPHEVNANKFLPLENDRRWIRLKRIFSVAFQHDIAQRFQSATEIQERLKTLMPSQEDGGSAAIEEEIARMDDLLASDRGRKIEESKSLLVSACGRLKDRIAESLAKTRFVCGGNGPNLINGNTAARINFLIVPTGASEPSVSYVHIVELEDTRLTATVTVEGESEDQYYAGKASDVESIYEAVDRKAVSVAALLLRKMREKLARTYGG